MVLVIGSYSAAKDPGVHFYQWDSQIGSFMPVGHITGIENPSYLSISKKKNLVYVVRENKEGLDSELKVYQFQGVENEPILIDRVTFTGGGSCHVTTDADDTHCFITNYGSGSLTAIKWASKNVEKSSIHELKFEGSGPHPDRQDQPHIHASMLAKDMKYLYCSDLGTDRIYRFNYDYKCLMSLKAAIPPYLSTPPGSGPRHLTSSADGRWLYVITELTGEILVYDTTRPNESWVQRISLVTAGFNGEIAAADLQLHPNGKWLYASNRGDANEIVVFSVEPSTGTLSFLQRIAAEGKGPRSLLICERRSLLLVANESSNNVPIFSIAADGYLEFTGKQLGIAMPTCLKYMDL